MAHKDEHDDREDDNRGTLRDRRVKGFVLGLVCCAVAVYAVIAGVNIFEPITMAVDDGDAAATQEAKKDETSTADPKKGSGDVPEPSSTLHAFHAAGLVAEVPDNWVEVDVAGVTAAAPEGDGSAGYLSLDSQSASDMAGTPAIDSAKAMEGFARTMASAQDDGDARANIAVQPMGEGRWSATIPVSMDVDGARLTGKQLLIGGGDTVHVATAVHVDGASQQLVNAFDAALASVEVAS